MEIENGNLNFCNGDLSKDLRIIYLLIPFIITSIIFLVVDFINDLKIRKNYNNMIYNWNTSPLKSINIDSVGTYELAKLHFEEQTVWGFKYPNAKENQEQQTKKKYYEWRNKFFRIERLNNFNYINIYQNVNGKKCGKDSFGNYLYFPEDVECPINDIIITSSSFEMNNLTDYNKLDLGGTFLYYTNKNTEGEIIIDLKVSNSSLFELNLDNTNELCNEDLLSCFDPPCNKYFKCESYYKFGKIPFSKKIDTWSKSYFFDKYNDRNSKIYLYSINYLGLNSTALPDKNYIENYSNYLGHHNRLAISKFIFFIIAILMYIIIHIKYFITLSDEYKLKSISCYYFVLFILFIVNMTLTSLCLCFNLEYIHNFMNKINKDFEYNKAEFYLNIAI